MKQRDIAVDIAKAYGILLMILGHCGGIPFLLRNFIFSFHMPLFFILSGYFFKAKPLKDVFKSGNTHLVKPYLITSFFYVLLCLTAQRYDIAGKKVVGTIMSNGGWPSEMFGSTLPYIGPIWFLLALYWCKIFYTYLKQITDKCLLYSFIVSTIALIIGKYIVNLPFGILTGFCGLIFYAMGDYWKNKMVTPMNKTHLLVGIIIWGLCIWKGHLELATFDCNRYPFSMLAAFIGTYVTFLIASKTPKFIQPILVWIGQHTLLILCYHTLTFSIMLNIKHYFLVPNGIELHGIVNPIISFGIGLGLPLLHYSILSNIKKEKVN